MAFGDSVGIDELEKMTDRIAPGVAAERRDRAGVEGSHRGSETAFSLVAAALRKARWDRRRMAAHAKASEAK
jgi:hypothetical protein